MSRASYGTALRSHYDWRDEAACLGSDPEMFFPVGTSGEAPYQTATALEVCNGIRGVGGCPVRAQCLYFAVSTGQDAGIWGGLTEEERRAMKRRQARQRRAL